MSLGIDLLLLNSICSFNCTYCQLGFIQIRINERRLFVPTSKLIKDLKESRWSEAEIITFSGNGEPTLALNLGEALAWVRAYTGKPTLVLTNGTLLHLPEVQRELAQADKIFFKLDAASEETFQKINRPVSGVTLEGIVQSILEFKNEYPGYLAIQIMITHVNLHETDRFAELLNLVRPQEVQLNAPTRPYPKQWVPQTRGSHDGVDYAATPLKRISPEQAVKLRERLKELTGLPVLSVYGN